MRRNRISVLVLAVAMVVGFALSAHAEVEKSATADVSVMSNYVWRGQKLSEDWVIQPSITLTYGGFGANLWANYDSDRDPGNGSRGEVSEVDYTLSYSRSIGKVGLSGGYIYYGLDGAADTQEVYLSASVDTLLKPTLAVYVDIEEGSGAFAVASIGHSFALPKDISLDLGASASYDLDNKVMGAGKDGKEFSDFYNGEVSASLAIPVAKDVTVKPKVAYSFALSDDAEFALENISFDGDQDVVYGGVTVAVSF